MVSKLDIIPMKTIYFMIFRGFECTNFKNLNLSSLCVCFFFPRYFVKEYFKMPINLHTYHIFWVRGCHKFHRGRLRSWFEIPSKLHRIVWKLHIFNQFSSIWMHQLQKFKSLQVCIQILWQNFCWRVLPSVYRMTCLSYFLDTWL